jgi:hypothetical protein
MLADLLPNAATAPSTVRVAKEMATWQLSRIRVGMASPVARWVKSMTWMATLRPLRTSSSTSRDSSATAALWALTSGLVPFALVEEGVGLVDDGHDQRPGRRGAEVPGVGHAQDLGDAGLAVDHQPMHPPKHVADLAEVVLGRQPGPGGPVGRSQGRPCHRPGRTGRPG